MKRFLVILTSVLSFFTLVMSCQQAPMLSVSGPRSYTFTRDGGSQSFTFTCNKDWSVSTTESWISVSPSSGSASDGETTVTLRCNPNTTYDPRTATLTIKEEYLAETITVNQETGVGLIVSPKTFDLTNAEQVIEIEVQDNVQYSITIDDAGKSWITHTDTKGLSTERAVFSIAANDTYDNREAKITFNQTDGSLSETVVVRQSQTNGIFITTPEYDLSNEAHTLTVEVKANVEYEVTSQADWVKYVSTSTKALTPTQITLQVDANETYDDREGQVIVKQKGGDLMGTIIIRQDENYGIFISPESVTMNSRQQDIEVEVDYNIDFEVIIPDKDKGTMISSVKYKGGEETKALSKRVYCFGITENGDNNARETVITFKQNNGSLSGTMEIYQEKAPVNLSVEGTANCYIVPSSGEYFFDANKRGNTSKEVGDIVSVMVVWETFNTGEKPQIGDLISSSWVEDGIVHFMVPRSFRSGNALIAVKDISDVILWSWHIWITDANLNDLSQTYVNGAGALMDRNLGALSSSPGDYLAAGLLYQWGRKDPFINGIKYGSSEYAASTIDWPNCSTYANHENGTIEYTIQNPTIWMRCNGYNGDWLYTGDSSFDRTRWNDDKGEYDPCPNGWRVPSGGPEGFWSKAFGRYDKFDGYYMWDNEHTGYHLNVLVDTSKDAWFPMSHAKNVYDGTIGNTGYNSANLWTCTYGEHLVLWNGGSIEPNFTRDRTWGFSIRCQRVDN